MHYRLDALTRLADEWQPEDPELATALRGFVEQQRPPAVTTYTHTGRPLALVLNFDGSCRRNPGGPGGYGWRLLRDDGEYLNSGDGALAPHPELTSNACEWHGLLAGLRYVRSLVFDEGWRAESLTVRGDSKLVINQAAGRWKCKAANLFELAAQGREHVAALANRVGRSRVRFVWVPREQNRECDALSKGRPRDA